MSQISPPFRIALVALLAVCALWFTVLRPKPAADAPLPAAPGTTGLGKGVAAAKGAAATSDAANARVQSATGGTAAKSASQPATGTAAAGSHTAVAGKAASAGSAAAQRNTAAKPAAPADLSTPLLRALDRNHAVVLVFWNRRGADDNAVRHAAQAVDRRHGRVLVKVAPISSVGRYTAITRGVQILEAPTALVLAPGREARVIAGFTSTPELDQAVADALAKVKAGK